MTARLLELDLARTCTELLELDGWRALKTDPVSRREWAKGFGEKGMADYLYIRYWKSNPERQGGALAQGTYWSFSLRDAQAEIMWIEWKRAKTGRVEQHQFEWRAKEHARGALALIAGIDFDASIEGFARFYAASGLQRRKFALKERAM